MSGIVCFFQKSRNKSLLHEGHKVVNDGGYSLDDNVFVFVQMYEDSDQGVTAQIFSGPTNRTQKSLQSLMEWEVSHHLVLWGKYSYSSQIQSLPILQIQEPFWTSESLNLEAPWPSRNSDNHHPVHAPLQLRGKLGDLLERQCKSKPQAAGQTLADYIKATRRAQPASTCHLIWLDPWWAAKHQPRSKAFLQRHQHFSHIFPTHSQPALPPWHAVCWTLLQQNWGLNLLLTSWGVPNYPHSSNYALSKCWLQ